MDFEEIDSLYKKELELAENKFVKEKFQDKDDGSEKKYKNNVRSIRDKYYSSTTHLLAQKKKEIQVRKPSLDIGKTQQFKVESSSYDLSKVQRLKYRWQIAKFDMYIFYRNKIKRRVPDFLIFGFLRARLKTNRFFTRLKYSISRTYNSLIGMLVSSLKFIWDKIQTIPELIFGKIVKSETKKSN